LAKGALGITVSLTNIGIFKDLLNILWRILNDKDIPFAIREKYYNDVASIEAHQIKKGGN
jgi:hypothetical protein